MWKRFSKLLHLPVFIPSIIIIVLLAVLCILFPIEMKNNLNLVKSFISDYFGWFYVLSVSLFIIFLLLISGSRLGDIRLGGDDEKPEYSFISWFSMLFASGMGIGLMYFGVAEPISHYAFPILDGSSEIEKTKNAILISFYHWGIHAWAIYAIMGLALAYFGFRYKLPLTIRSGFYPILKEHSNKLCGNIIDVIALFSTVFGISTSLGFGALQINAGLTHLGFVSEQNIGTQIILIVSIMFIVAISTFVGIAKGMKKISEINLFMAFILLVSIIILGPTVFLLSGFTENIGYYVRNLIDLSFTTFAYDDSKKSWISGWTILYWAWWVSWAPFVGLFIAKISRGRTVREFILGVLFIPSLFNFIWMSVFGNSAILVNREENNSLVDTISNTSILLFKFLESYPFGSALSIIALIVIALFFITSADSGVHVINSISSKGSDKSTPQHSAFWIVLMIVISCSLLYSGGLEALQTMTLITTLPFCIIMLFLCIGVWKGLLVDNQYFSKKFTYSSRYWKTTNWKEQLNKIIVDFTELDVKNFLETVAKPAFHLVSLELSSYSVKATINSDDKSFIEIVIPQKNKHNFIYGIRCESKSQGKFEPTTYFSDGRNGYDVKFMHQEELITDILRQYDLYLNLIKDDKHALKTSIE